MFLYLIYLCLSVVKNKFQNILLASFAVHLYMLEKGESYAHWYVMV
jgi:hypothetical protein